MRGADREAAGCVRPSLGQQQRPRCGGQGGLSQARAAYRCQPRRRLQGWAPASSGAGHGGSEASQAGTWQPCAARWVAACAAAATSHWHEGLRAHGGGEQRSVGSVPGSLAGCRATKPSRQPGGQQPQSATPVRRSRGLAAKLVLQRQQCDHRSAQEIPSMSQQRHRDPQRTGL